MSRNGILANEKELNIRKINQIVFTISSVTEGNKSRFNAVTFHTQDPSAREETL